MLLNTRVIQTFPSTEHGLLRPSFIPPVEQRDLRDLTRHRSNLVRERVNDCQSG